MISAREAKYISDSVELDRIDNSLANVEKEIRESANNGHTSTLIYFEYLNEKQINRLESLNFIVEETITPNPLDISCNTKAYYIDWTNP